MSLEYLSAGGRYTADPPVPGMWRFLEAAWQQFDIAIYSSRSHQPGGIEAMHAWFLQHATSRFQYDLARKWLIFPSEKPPAFLTIDDRALCFTGEWPSVESLLAFRPWNKR